MSVRIFVVDTSYLLELYRVGKDFKEDAHFAIKNKFEIENKSNSHFYFPIPVLFEFANHIADAGNRNQVISYLNDLIKMCLDDDIPYFITPCSNAESVKEFIQDLSKIINRFSAEFVQQRLGLTDASIISEAECLAEKYSLAKCKVHIWTTHEALKAREPEPEINPYLN